jgi:hypothetical protein
MELCFSHINKHNFLFHPIFTGTIASLKKGEVTSFLLIRLARLLLSLEARTLLSFTA